MDDEMDDILRELENGGNPALNAIQKERQRDAEKAAKIRTVAKVVFVLGVAVVIGGLMTLGKSVFSLIGAIAGGVLLSASASALAASNIYDPDDDIAHR
ncbi:MAG: hypothetical protein IKO14_06975 [Oscillibacter sp.]|nr:hypothetical protein [Oscillibacter sp.]